MFKAITVKSLGATEHKPARIVAQAGPNRLIVPYEYEGMDLERAKAAQALARKLGWTGRYIMGELPDGRTSVFVKADTECHVDYAHTYGFGIGQEIKYDWKSQ